MNQRIRQAALTMQSAAVHTFEQCSRALCAIDWRGRNAPQVAQSRLAEILEEYLCLLQATANQADLATDRLLRNSIADCPFASLGFYQLLLEYVECKGESPLGPAHKSIRSMLPEPDLHVRSMRSLFEPEFRPGSEAISALAPGQRVARFERALEELHESTEAGSKSRLHGLIDLCLDIFGSRRHGRALPKLALVLESSDFRVPKLSMTEFQRLPSTLRKDILESANLRSQLMVAASRKNLDGVAERAAALGLLSDVPLGDEMARNIDFGCFMSSVVMDGLAIWQVAHPKVRSAIRRAEFRSSVSYRKSSRIPSDIPECRALQLLGQPQKQLPRAIEQMSGDERAAVLEMINAPSLLKALFSVRMSENLLAQLMAAGVGKSEIASAFMATCAKEVMKDVRLLLLLLKKNVLTASDLSSLNAHLRQSLDSSIGQSSRMGLANPRQFGKVMAASNEARDFCASFLFDLSRLSEYGEEALHRLLPNFGDLLANRIPANISLQTFEQLMHGRGRAALLESLSNRTFRNSCEAWVSYVEKVGSGGGNLPDEVLKAVAGDEDWLREVFRLFPILVADVVLREWPLEESLEFGFRNKWFARLLDEQVPLEKRVGKIEWAQERTNDSPMIRAAKELSLLVGVRFTPYLISLALRLAKKQGSEGARFDDLYHTYDLPKQAGGKRTITVPEDPLKALQRALLRNGFEVLDTSPWATGFRKGTSIVDNAAAHTDQDLVVNVDISAFFPNTSHKAIRWVCSQLADNRLSWDAINLAAEICSYQGGLPMGAPTSPAIANIALKMADRVIAKACQRRGLNYTRYADDLTFSGSAGVVEILPFVARVLGEQGYRLDPKKTNIFRKGRRQVVTGLVVNQRPNMARPLRRRLRAAVHRRCQGQQAYWHGKPISDRELMGRLAFLGQTQPEEAGRLRQALRQSAGSLDANA